MNKIDVHTCLCIYIDVIKNPSCEFLHPGFILIQSEGLRSKNGWKKVFKYYLFSATIHTLMKSAKHLISGKWVNKVCTNYMLDTIFHA